MDTIIIRYEKLFSILLTHLDFPVPANGQHWATSIANEMRIEPDSATKALFDQYEIQYRFEYDTLRCFTRVKPAMDRTFHQLPADFSARFLVKASDRFIAGTALSSQLGGERVYHIRVKLKTKAATGGLSDSLLTTVASATPELVFHPGYADSPSHWEQRPVAISGCLAVLDIVTEGSGKNRLFKQETTQTLNYTAANGKANEHLFNIILKD